jgi:REP element-mobilizing transposase RayT
MAKFKGKYRIESTRLPDWDYAGHGWYFVTLCAWDHICFFGEIVDGEMRLSPIGEIVAQEWQRTPLVRSNVKLDEWVIMPNHLHGIIAIMGPSERVGEAVPAPSQLRSRSLGATIGQVKSVCTKRIWAEGYTDFAWQSRFHDHIIRDEGALARMREYIADNVAKWELDRYHPVQLR